MSKNKQNQNSQPTQSSAPEQAPTAPAETQAPPAVAGDAELNTLDTLRDGGTTPKPGATDVRKTTIPGKNPKVDKALPDSLVTRRTY